MNETKSFFFCTDEFVSLKISRTKWDHFTAKAFKFDFHQPYISTYFAECAKDQLQINMLLSQNSDLRDEIRRNNAEALMKPNFLKELLEHNIANNNKNRASYNEHMKDIALYIYVLTGPKAYVTLCSNLRGSLPSLSTVRRKLGKEKNMNEADFQFDQIKGQMLEKGEKLIVAVAEDDTEITPRLRYDWINDQIVGLMLPLSENGTPIEHCFRFSTLRNVKEFIEKNSLSSYAKLITIRSIMPKATT